MPDPSKPPAEITCPGRVEWNFRCESKSGTTPSYTVAEDEAKQRYQDAKALVEAAANSWQSSAKCAACPKGGKCNLEIGGPVTLYGDWAVMEAAGSTWRNSKYYGFAWAKAVTSVSCACNGFPAPEKAKVGGTDLKLGAKKAGNKN